MDNISYNSGNCGIEDEMMVRRYVDILTDAGFKAVFGDQRNSDVLIDLINVMLPDGKKVREIAYATTEIPGFSPFNKSIRIDLRCTGEDNSSFHRRSAMLPPGELLQTLRPVCFKDL